MNLFLYLLHQFTWLCNWTTLILQLHIIANIYFSQIGNEAWGLFWGTLFHEFLLFLPVLLGMPSLRDPDYFFLPYFSRLCLQWATLREELISAPGTKSRLAHCLLWIDGISRSVFLSCNVTCYVFRHPSGPLHIANVRMETHVTQHKHADPLAAIFCLWSRS